MLNSLKICKTSCIVSAILIVYSLYWYNQCSQSCSCSVQVHPDAVVEACPACSGTKCVAPIVLGVASVVSLLVSLGYLSIKWNEKEEVVENLSFRFY